MKHACMTLLLASVAILGCGGGSPTVPGYPAKPGAAETTEAPKAGAAPEPFPEQIAAAWTKAGAHVGWMRLEPKWNMLVFAAKDKWQMGDVPAFHLVANSVKDLPRPETPFGLWLQGVAYTDDRMEDVAAFENLRMLRFTLATKLTGEGLKELRGLKNLQFLDLGGYGDTPINESVLAALAANGQLHRLTLARGKDGKRPDSPQDVVALSPSPNVTLNDSSLRSLKSLGKLESIQLVGPGFSDASLDSLANFENLSELSLARSAVTDEGLSRLVRVKSLRKLDLSGTKVTDAGLKHLNELKSLESLLLADTKLTGAGLKDLNALPKLQRLILDQTRIADAELSHVKDLTGLRDLGLARTGVTDAGVQVLCTLKNLKSLDLDGTKITDASLASLAKAEQLERLGLSLTAITDVGLKDVQGLKRLKGLDISMTLKTSESAVKQLQKALPDCQISWGVPRY
ncbi:MAG: hypothetical protein U0791_05620 [Gemmataceae bacterium]